MIKMLKTKLSPDIVQINKLALNQGGVIFSHFLKGLLFQGWNTKAGEILLSG